MHLLRYSVGHEFLLRKVHQSNCARHVCVKNELDVVTRSSSNFIQQSVGQKNF